MFAVMAAFVLLAGVAGGGEFVGVFADPLTLLALPSFTVLGMVMTGLRWWAICGGRSCRCAGDGCVGSLCGGAGGDVEFGKFFEGDDAGMPTRAAVGC